MKPGYKTTEFWAAGIVSSVGLLVFLGLITPEMGTSLSENLEAFIIAVEKMGGAAMAIVPIGVYAWGRSKQKATQIKTSGLSWDLLNKPQEETTAPQENYIVQ